MWEATSRQAVGATEMLPGLGVGTEALPYLSGSPHVEKGLGAI